MIHQEAWYRESLFSTQLSLLLRKVEQGDDDALIELDHHLRRTGFWELRVIPLAKEQVIPEEDLSGGYEAGYTSNPAYPDVGWWEIDFEDTPTQVLSTEFDPGTWTFDVKALTTHKVKVVVGEELLEHPELGDLERPYDVNTFLDLPTIEKDWEKIVEKIALGETHNQHGTSPGYARVDFLGVEVVSYTRDPEADSSRVIEGPNYDEWFLIDWLVTFKVKWGAMIPVDEVLPR